MMRVAKAANHDKRVVVASSHALAAERSATTLNFGRVDAVMVGWFFVWPVVFFACLSLVTPGDTLEACLSVAGSLLWLLSCYWICGMLFAMAVARWPGATTIRKILSFVVDLLRAFQGHHPP